MPGQDTVDHKDGHPGNNFLKNLRYASRSEQILHSFRTNKNRKSNARKQSKPVLGRKQGTDEWTRYDSFQSAAKELGLRRGNVSKCCNKKVNHTGGYEFEFAGANEPDLLEGEEWRQVAGTKAAVSSLGRFRSTRGVVSTPSPRVDGYVYVRINKKSHQIHRLIAEVFNLPREPGQDTVNHEDGDPSNNVLSNLRWASQSEQVLDSYERNKNRKSSALRRSKPVLGRKQGTDEWTRYENSYAAAKELGVHGGSVSACCNKKRTQTKGYEFEFAEPNEPDTLEGEEWRDVILECA